jgi:hypothetical protein
MKIELNLTPIQEQLPELKEGEIYRTVVVYTEDGEITSSDYHSSGFYDPYDEGIPIGGVTHWCEQPSKMGAIEPPIVK